MSRLTRQIHFGSCRSFSFTRSEWWEIAIGSCCWLQMVRWSPCVHKLYIEHIYIGIYQYQTVPDRLLELPWHLHPKLKPPTAAKPLFYLQLNKVSERGAEHFETGATLMGGHGKGVGQLLLFFSGNWLAAKGEDLRKEWWWNGFSLDSLATEVTHWLRIRSVKPSDFPTTLKVYLA